MPTPPSNAGSEPRGDADSPGGPRDSFLDRRSFGLPRYLLIAVAVTFALVFIPRGARRALESNTNKAEDWLPASYAESADLKWFRSHFAHEAFVLVSWDGCTLGDPEKVRLLERKLRAVKDPGGGWAWYPRVVTGPGTVETLASGAASLSRAAAVERLEGALVGPEKLDAAGQPLGEGSRTTCLLAYLDDRLTTNNLRMRRAVERVRDLAHEECGVPLDAIRMGGPPVDNITIDVEGERTLVRLAGLAGAVGLALAYLAFRSVPLTAMVFWTAGASAGMSLSLVYWFGGVERLLTGLAEARLGKADAILMSMPAVIYVMALSGAIHLVNYYRDERLAGGKKGAVERAVRASLYPSFLCAFTTAVGLGSLGASDILPIQKFGIFTAIGVMVAFGLLYGIMPVLLHRFPPSRRVVEERAAHAHGGGEWYAPLARFTTLRWGVTTALCSLALAALALGLPQIKTSVQLLKLLDDGCDLVADYTWLEANLGNLVPMEVVVALDADQLRAPDEVAVAPDGAPRYRMTMHERAQLVAKLQAAVESLGPVSRALSAATFAPQPSAAGSSASARRAVEFTVSEALEDSRDALAEHLQREVGPDGKPTGRELWRVSARVTALADIDYGQFVDALRRGVEPVLDAYRLRDELVAKLAQEGLTLDAARVCLVTAANDPESPRLPKPGTAERRLAELLLESVTGGVTVYAAEAYESADEAKRERVLDNLRSRFDTLVTLDPAAARKLEGVEVAALELAPAPPDAPIAARATAVYTGVVPLVYKTQRELLQSLRQSILWATVLIAGVMMVALRSVGAGVAAMIPNVFPIVVVFGTLGHLGVKVDIGIMMSASVALGVAVDDTLHFLTWFSRGVREGLDRRSAVLGAYDRCATAMLQTTLIGGLGLAVFAVSTFTPTQQFGTMMITILGVALVGDLVMLPALLCGPLGWFFAPGSAATPPDGRAPAPIAGPIASPVRPVFIDDPIGHPPLGPTPPEPAPMTRLDEPEALSPANAALRSKLRRLRREA